MKKYLSLLAMILCCLVGSTLPGQTVLAAGTGNEEATVRVVFTNEQNDSPDLYVTKTVETAGDYDASNDEFTFVLKLDGEFASRVSYTVTDENGDTVYNTSGLVQTETFRTDRSGTFTLKAGQTAKFSDVGTGTTYEVSELTQDGWVQIYPANGAAASGTVTQNGSWAEFTNMVGGSGESEIMIQKTISFPSGYTAPETPEFTFVIEIDGKAYSNESYTVYSISTGLEAETGKTDAKGQFTLKGGQYVLFEDVEEEVDYKIYEVTDNLPDGWYATGTTSHEGSTGDGHVTVLTFNNASASFVVTKKMEDNSTPDTEFTFQLTDENRSEWAQATYYLYTTGGDPVTDDDDNIVTGTTDANGYFTLKAGQAAIFYGIKSGTVYNVREVASTGYVQVVPLSSSGYTDKVVSDAVEILPFTNAESEEYGLSVTKVVESLNGEMPLEDKEFTFQLELLDTSAVSSGGEATYKIKADVVYSVTVGTSTSTYKTDENGQFTLKANETAVFSGLTAGTYRVTEIEDSTSMEYTAVESVQEGELTSAASSLAFTFTNKYATRFFDLYLVKQSRNQKVALPGAKFILYRDAYQNNPVENPDSNDPDDPYTYTSDADGKITITGLKTGTYYLVETESPTGYQLLVDPIEITVTWVGSVMNVTVDGRTVTSEDDDSQIYIVKSADPDTKNDEVHIAIYNSKGFTLPSTGGAGIFVIVLIGIAGMAVILWFFVARRLRRRS